MTVAIKVESLSKKYIINHVKKSKSYETFSDTLVQGSKNIAKRIIHPFSYKVIDPNAQEEFWALEDINFEINKGDKVGIIGRNGAGKSTLLKVLSRITEPTLGKIHINGRIASLLEVGTGFHPELSGRENIYLNGAILGMSRTEIKAKFDEIVDFAEVEQFLDTPVKRYSSGMYVRLAFSVAAHLEPEILVVDEVLAVGDASFQKKCLGKMNTVSKEGRTVIFVSHNMQAIKQLCNKFIYLKDGGLVEIGESEQVISNYLMGGQDRGCGKEQVKDRIKKLPKDSVFNLLDIELNQNGIDIFDLVENGSNLYIKIQYEVFKKTSGLRLYFDLVDEYETLLFRSFNDEQNNEIPVTMPGKYISVLTLPANLLGPTQYIMKVHAGIHNVRNIFTLEFTVSVENNGIYNKAYLGDTFRGKLALHLAWATSSLGE
jgi:lipopolysaccharide transport system ATP-binding protein